MYGLQSENPGQLQKLDNWLRTTYKLVLQVCLPSYLTVHPQVLVQGVVTQTIGHGTAQLTPDPKAIPRRGPTTTETATETTTDPTLHARQMEVDRSAYLTAPNPTDLTLLRHQNVSNATRRVTTLLTVPARPSSAPPHLPRPTATKRIQYTTMER